MHRSERETALVGVRFSRRSCDRGGNPLACAYGRRGPPRYGENNVPITVGRGPVPRHASIGTGNGLGRRAVFAQVVRSRGTGPRATGLRTVPFTVGRGPVPRHASIGTGNGLGRRAVFAQVERSRGTGPRATGPEGVRLAMRRSGSGDPELQFSAPNLANHDNRDNPAPLWLILLITMATQNNLSP